MSYASAEQLKEVLMADAPEVTDPFGTLSQIATWVSADPDNADVHDTVLLALDKQHIFETCGSMLDSIAHSIGLHPYTEPQNLGVKEQLIYEFHRPANMDDPEVVFHRIQAEVYHYLMDGESVILSAPTSFGKSLIIDAIVASMKYANIVIVVPTIALIDETRRRLSRFREHYKIITHASQGRADRNIFVLTQERVLDFPDLDSVDFFVIDEFYKIDPTDTGEQRATTLNQAFYALYQRCKLFYMLGPNIESIAQGFPGTYRSKFIWTDYSTVVCDVVRVRPSSSDEEALVDLCRNLSEPTIIYCRSPKQVNETCDLLLANLHLEERPALIDAARWIGDNYHPDWTLVKGIQKGVGMHHGRVPRALAQFIVQAFNEGTIHFLVCTSTLIEGVNTKAKNVVIYSNKIATRKFDYFTFNNIRGRAGRMFHHFVGKVFVFNDPPQTNLPFVDIPLYSQGESAAPELLLQLEEADLTAGSHKRLEPIMQQDLIASEILRANASFDPFEQLKLAEKLMQVPATQIPLLQWASYPTGQQLKFVCDLIWDLLFSNHQMKWGVASGRQLVCRIEGLRHAPSIRALIDAEIKPARPASEAVESVLEFVRRWAMFTFPRALTTVDSIQKAILRRREFQPGNYAAFATAVENLFIDPALAVLDEYGVPLETARKLDPILAPEGNLDSCIERLRALDLDELDFDPFEVQMLKNAVIYL